MAFWTNHLNYEITTDKSKINFSAIHKYLAEESYWSQGIPIEILEKAVANSICFSVLSPNGDFVGFARVISDRATFGYLADVVIFDEYRGLGLGKWLIQTIMNYEEFKILRNWFLYTKDAHSLYERFGWKPLERIERAMAISIPANQLYGI